MEWLQSVCLAVAFGFQTSSATIRIPGESHKILSHRVALSRDGNTLSSALSSIGATSHMWLLSTGVTVTTEELRF